jgi:hypothetical protein
MYPSYGAAAAAWHVDALEDQQLAGLLMWVPSGLVFIVFGLALLAAWLGEAERRVRLGSTGLVAAVRRPDGPPPREALRRTAEALAEAGQVGRSGISDA